MPWQTVCARCSRTEACQMKRGWKPSKTNLRKPDSWLKKPTENTTRWPFFVSWLKDFIPNSFTTHKYINKYFQPRHKHVLVVGFDDRVRCFFSFVHMIVENYSPIFTLWSKSINFKSKLNSSTFEVQKYNFKGQNWRLFTNN